MARDARNGGKRSKRNPSGMSNREIDAILRQLYQPVLDEPIPEKLKKILKDFEDEREKRRKKRGRSK